MWSCKYHKHAQAPEGMGWKGSDLWVQNRLSQPSQYLHIQIGEFFHKTETKHIFMFPKNDIQSHLKALSHSEVMTFEDYATVSVTLQNLGLNC